jgi:hypothetical protein
MTSIEALSPVFSADANGDRFCTTKQGRHNLVHLGERLAGSDSLVGLYVTESAEPDYQPDPAQHGPCGRVGSHAAHASSTRG